MSQKSENEIVEQFHKLYYSNGGRTWSGNTSWLGYKVLKCPLDLFIYQEIIHETKPDIIIETGTGNAGTTHFLASICDFINSGKIISIDTENTNHKSYLPSHKRITYITGSSISENTIDQIKDLINKEYKIMVILDSDHHKNHVLSELNIYNQLVTKNNYLIVEDTNLNHPNPTDFEGPMEAIEEFLKINQDFIIDESKHKFYLTFNPRGYLKRIYL
jgi:cephalosporin hydroxylase